MAMNYNRKRYYTPKYDRVDSNARMTQELFELRKKVQEIDNGSDKALTLLRQLIQALEVDGFGHVKGVNAKEATAVYHEYLDGFITKN
jgi:hypothetical protein